MKIAERVDRLSEGRVTSLQKRIDNVRMRTEQRRLGESNDGDSSKYIFNKNTKSKVVCLEWIDLFFTAGDWVPQMVEIAGGINGLTLLFTAFTSYHHIDEIIKFNPDKIILMPCGFDVDRTLDEAKIWKLMINGNH